MPITVAVLEAKLVADIRNFDRGMKTAAKRLTTVEKSTKKLDNRMGDLRKGLRKVGVLLGVGFGLRQAGRFIGSTISSVSKLTESVNAVEVVFGDASASILQFASDTEDSVFVAASAVNQLATETGALLTNFGFSQDEAAASTIELTKRAADMASVFDTSVNDALLSINAALRGQTRPIRRYGASLDEALVKAEFFGDAVGDATREMTQSEKVATRLDLILRQTAVTQGDAANTAGEYANQTRKLGENLETAKVKLGQILIPIATGFIPTVITAIEVTADWATKLAAAFGSNTALGIVRNKEAIDSLADAITSGVSVTDALRDAQVHLVRSGFLTADSMGALAEASGLTEEQIALATRATMEFTTAMIAADTGSKGFGDRMVTNTDAAELLKRMLFDNVFAMGLTRVEAVNLARDLGLLELAYLQIRDLDTGDLLPGFPELSFDFPIPELTGEIVASAVAWRETWSPAVLEAVEASDELRESMSNTVGYKIFGDAIEDDVVDPLQSAAQAAEDARKANEQFVNGLTNMVTLLGRAKSALDSHNQLLEDIGEEGNRTADEMFDFGISLINLDSAVRALGGGNLEKGIVAMASALKVPADIVRQMLIDLGLIDGFTGNATVFIDFQTGQLPTGPAAPSGIDRGIREDFAAMTASLGGPTIGPGSGIPGFATGGVVPGPIGAPVAAIVHGGELISPAGGGDTTIVQLALDGRVIEEIWVKGGDIARRRGRG